MHPATHALLRAICDASDNNLHLKEGWLAIADEIYMWHQAGKPDLKVESRLIASPNKQRNYEELGDVELPDDVAEKAKTAIAAADAQKIRQIVLPVTGWTYTPDTDLAYSDDPVLSKNGDALSVEAKTLLGIEVLILEKIEQGTPKVFKDHTPRGQPIYIRDPTRLVGPSLSAISVVGCGREGDWVRWFEPARVTTKGFLGCSSCGGLGCFICHLERPSVHEWTVAGTEESTGFQWARSYAHSQEAAQSMIDRKIFGTRKGISYRVVAMKDWVDPQRSQ